MAEMKEIFEKYANYPIALYGLSLETEKVLQELKDYKIKGLLDSYQKQGTEYGQDIIDLEDCIDLQIKLIIVVARPGSCKAIARRIGDFCQSNNIELLDINGMDLLSEKTPLFSLDELSLITKSDMLEQCSECSVVSFDLFDTLVMRKVLYSSDIFVRMSAKIKQENILIEDFTDKRMATEKRLSMNYAPTLEEIYRELLKTEDLPISYAEKLAQWEWQLDFETLIPRYDMVSMVNELLSDGKRICIVSDTYYSRPQIEQIISKIGIAKDVSIFLSCELGMSKTQGLFKCVKDKCKDNSFLHIGDDEVADKKAAEKEDFSTVHILSALDMWEKLGGFGLNEYIRTYNDRLKIGIMISALFNSPFLKDKYSKKIRIASAEELGYCLIGAIITDFVFWFCDKVEQLGIKNIWFGARDGYLMQKLYDYVMPDRESVYFLISRIAALRAGIFTEKDIEYVTNMNYSGTYKEQLQTRFGIVIDDSRDDDKYVDEILKKCKASRNNYCKYIKSLNLDDTEIAFFDFVAKGTSQLFCQRLVSNRMIGLYFLQLPNNSEIATNLEVFSFIDTENKQNSSIFQDYYILETILTSPQSSIVDFDDEGKPIYGDESRTKEEIESVLAIQQGIIEFFRDFVRLRNTNDLQNNTLLSEAILNLIHKFEISEEITKMKVEDNFFNRFTNVKDLV